MTRARKPGRSRACMFCGKPCIRTACGEKPCQDQMRKAKRDNNRRKRRAAMQAKALHYMPNIIEWVAGRKSRDHILNAAKANRVSMWAVERLMYDTMMEVRNGPAS